LRIIEIADKALDVHTINNIILEHVEYGLIGIGPEGVPQVKWKNGSGPN
jgi:hypothetical protein